MPFINSKITVEVPQEKRDILKAELGKAISDFALRIFYTAF